MYLLLSFFFERISSFIRRLHLDLANHKFRYVPKSVIVVNFLMAVNAITQAGLDIILESLVLLEMVPKIPFRLDFISLTLLSALLAWQTLKGLARKELDVTRNSVQVSLFVEVFLVVGDVYFITSHLHTNLWVLYFRLPFVILTGLNIFILIYIVYRLKLFWFRDRIGNIT